MLRNRFKFALAALVVLQSICFAQYEVLVNPQKVLQGQSFSIAIDATENIEKITAQVFNQNIKCYRNGVKFKGIIGVALEQAPGSYPLEAIITGKDGSQEKVSCPIEIVKNKFPSASFYLKPARKKLLSDRDLIGEEWAEIEKTLITESSFQYWTGNFIFPAKGAFSMFFGTREHINGKFTGRHRGLDMAIPAGSKVYAPAGGKVVFAKKLKAFGGTVVVDHGQGVNSLYFHLSKIAAAVGEEVAKGELLAFSGNSGISSGPHLHWGLSVHNLRVDPKQWVEQGF